MRTIRLTVVFAALLAFSAAALAQISIPQTRVQFSFPNGGWKFLEAQQIDKNAAVYLYSYNAEAVVDKMGDTILPFMRIYVRNNHLGSVYDFAYKRYLQQPFQSIEEYSTGMPGEQGLGYLGGYTNTDDGKDYAFRMMYFKDKTTLFEIRIETTTDTYRRFEKEFDGIMKSFTIKK